MDHTTIHCHACCHADSEPLEKVAVSPLKCHEYLNACDAADASIVDRPGPPANDDQFLILKPSYEICQVRPRGLELTPADCQMKAQATGTTSVTETPPRPTTPGRAPSAAASPRTSPAVSHLGPTRSLGECLTASEPYPTRPIGHNSCQVLLRLFGKTGLADSWFFAAFSACER